MGKELLLHLYMFMRSIRSSVLSLNVPRASLVIGLVFIVVASLLAYFFSPKGENQT